MNMDECKLCDIRKRTVGRILPEKNNHGHRIHPKLIYDRLILDVLLLGLGNGRIDDIDHITINRHVQSALYV